MLSYHHDQSIYHWCRFFFLFIGREPTTWPANNCLQIMVCSCSLSSNCVWLQIIFCSRLNESALFSFFASLLLANGRSICFSKKFIKKTKLSDQAMKKLLNSSYHKISRFVSVSHVQIKNCLPKLNAHHWQIIFGQPRPNNYCWIFSSHFNL